MIIRETNTLIIGASISGLAAAACLTNQQIDHIIIEKENQAASPWRNHYDRLHLHTSKRLSNLPYKKFNQNIPRYPSRQQVVDYLEAYQTAFAIQPLYNTHAISVKRKDEYWIAETSNGAFRSKYLLMATGAYNKPRPISFKGIETFNGKILHSATYKTGKAFKDQHVLVVGFGNSACEITIDLYEQGALPSMSVRSPVNVIPRDVLGIPVLELSLLLSRLSPRLADAISAPLVNLLVGNITKLGLKKKPYGPLGQIRREQTIPLLDIGTIQHIRKGHIRVFADIDRVDANTVYFSDGKKENFNAIIAAIGYRQDFDGITGIEPSRVEDLQLPVSKQQYFGNDGLYFCGYWISPTGQIREIASDAKAIAADIAKRMRV